jgi:hypothetical protein
MTARRHVRLEKKWWIENRVHPDVFADEFEEAVRILTWLPGAGTLYLNPGITGLRRLYVPKVACHLYYTFDGDEVIVRALWGARRRKGPRLRP